MLSPNNQPFISILIAARNEEDNILVLLHSLERLTYPKEKLQILIGNDASTDKTAEILESFIQEKKHFKVFNIENIVSGLKGKTNVLAQLAHHAKGEFFFFTDADIEVPENWIETILEKFSTSKSDNQTNKRVGIVTGITLVRSNNWFEACQAVEWLFALKMMDFLAKFKIPTTGMGNNMAVLADAYWATGGYEKIGFSIVEDYALYQAIVKNGFDFCQAFDKSVMTLTKAPQHYFEQRKRWVAGGLKSGSNLTIPALIQGISFPILLIISLFNLKFSSSVLVFNFILNTIIGFSIFKKLGILYLLKYIPIYTIYMYVFWFLQFVSYFLPTKLVWKGRSY